MRVEKRVFGWYLLVALVFSSTVVTSVRAEEGCVSGTQKLSGEKVLASANTWGNLRGSKGSLKGESTRLLTEAVKTISSVKAPKPYCAATCAAVPANIVFSSVPHKYLTDYSEKQVCEERLKATTKTPIVYTGKVFDSLDDLNSWFGDFSQGKGTEGSDLYSKCDGVCSPQYKIIIVPHGEKLKVNAEVLCGPARDKDDNNYDLMTGYEWQCS